MRWVSVTLLVLFWSSLAPAWNGFGHMEIGAIAWERMTPAARDETTRLLKLNPQYQSWVSGVPDRQMRLAAFMKAATWPDEIKSMAGYKNENGNVPPGTPEASQSIGYADHYRHRYWHFIDTPFSTDGTTLQPAPEPNVLTQITAFRAALSDTALSDDVRSFDLVWLLHLIGDVHQPLHVADRFTREEPDGDAGGNKVLLSCCGQKKLHLYWDALPSKITASKNEEPQTAAARLPAADASLAADMDENHWASESFEIAKQSVYVAPVGATDGPFEINGGYEQNALAVTRQRIALAGARVARLLNSVFDHRSRTCRECHG